MTENNKNGIVYVLTNSAMPSIVKIGKTARENVETRLNELYSTGVPVPFECEYAGRVSNENEVEKAFHLAFGPYRINPKREFFYIEPEQAIALLRLMTIEDVTPALKAEADKVDVDSKESVKKLKSRRPPLNFAEMNIPIGAKLKFTQDEIEVEVLTEKKVKYEDEILSLTAATSKLLNLGRSVSPGPYWLYKGKTIRDIYEETYEAI